MVLVPNLYIYIYLQKFIKIRILAYHKSLKVIFCSCGFSFFIWQHNFFAMLSWSEKNTSLKIL